MHPKHTVPHTRKQFQVDRIAFFSDAIIAIAITLLVLEIKIPAIGKNASWNELRTVYSKQLIFPLLGMLFSFFMIGRLWIRHHELFEYITSYNNMLIRYNLYFLFSIVLLPVSTTFMMNNDNPKEISAIVFMINLALCHFFFLLLLSVIMNKKNHFYEHDALPVMRQQKQDCLLFLCFLLALSLISIFKVEWSQYVVYLFFIYRLYRRIRRARERRLNKVLGIRG